MVNSFSNPSLKNSATILFEARFDYLRSEALHLATAKKTASTLLLIILPPAGCTGKLPGLTRENAKALMEQDPISVSRVALPSSNTTWIPAVLFDSLQTCRSKIQRFALFPPLVNLSNVGIRPPEMVRKFVNKHVRNKFLKRTTASIKPFENDGTSIQIDDVRRIRLVHHRFLGKRNAFVNARQFQFVFNPERIKNFVGCCLLHLDHNQPGLACKLFWKSAQRKPCKSLYILACWCAVCLDVFVCHMLRQEPWHWDGSGPTVSGFVKQGNGK